MQGSASLCRAPRPPAFPTLILTSNHVQLWIRRIALLAYLIGGWAIPSTHCHPHTHNPGQIDACCETTSDCQVGGEPDDASSDVCGCDHPAGDAIACVDNGTDNGTDNGDEDRDVTARASPNPPQVLIQNASALDCGGLCAICISITLAEDAIASDLPTIDLVCRPIDRCETRAAAPSIGMGPACPRGPPKQV